MMKKMILLLMVVIVSLGVVGCSSNTEKQTTGKSAEPAVLRIGAQPYPLYASLYVAKNLGYLEEELKKVGAKYTWTEFNSGPLVNEAVAAGQADVGFMADMPALLAKSSGQDLQIIANVAYGEKALALIVRPDSDIKEVSQLKGKKVAYVKGSYAQHLIVLLLEKAGLTIKDIESVNLAAGDIPAALENKQIDAAVIWEQFISQLVTTNKARVVADGTGIKRGNLVIYAKTQYAQEHPDVLSAYIKANQRGSEYIKSHPKEAAEAIAKDLKVNAVVLESIFNNLKYDQTLTTEDINEIKKVKDYLLTEKLIQHDVDIDKFINLNYLKGAGLVK